MGRPRPNPLNPDDFGMADFRSTSHMHADARAGSRKLLNAILRLRSGKARRAKKRGPQLPFCFYGTWEDRQIAIAQIERLQRAVAGHYGMAPELMVARRGTRDIAQKRQLAMYLARTVIQASYPDIGRAFGGKDHTTVLHACCAVQSDPALTREAALLRERLGA